MDLHIMSFDKAMQYDPDKLTYALRISSPADQEDFDMFPLKESENYVKEVRYVFDSIDPNDRRVNSQHVVFDNELATKVLTDFAEYKDKCKALLIHCFMGTNRSPAIGRGLNGTFNLGHDDEELKAKYPASIEHIYTRLVQVGAQLF